MISSRPVLTGSSGCPTLSFVAGDGEDAVQSHLRRCCLRRGRAPPLGCSHVRSSYSPFSRLSACCQRPSPPHRQAQAKEVPGRRSPAPAPAPSTSTGDDITGLRCQTNRTLRFYVLDVALNWPLAVRLGAAGGGGGGGGGRNASLTHQGGDSEGGPFAAIVDLRDEVHYVLRRSPSSTLAESLGKDDTAELPQADRCSWTSRCLLSVPLEAFIRNFSAPYSLLQRHLVGEEDGAGGAGASNPPGEQQRSAPLPRPLVAELTTSSFLPRVMDVHKVNKHSPPAEGAGAVLTRLNACSSLGCPALLLHPVVWLLLHSQPHHHPAGQTAAGERHHRRGQVGFTPQLSTIELCRDRSPPHPPSSFKHVCVLKTG